LQPAAASAELADSYSESNSKHAVAKSTVRPAAIRATGTITGRVLDRNGIKWQDRRDHRSR
jgi:hypothetical protein